MESMSEMESMLGFNEILQEDVIEDNSQSLKLVPWMNWDEWKFVRGSLFSSSPESVASALKRINTWRSRGCIPVAIEVTASIIEIQQQDPYFRDEWSNGCSQAEEMLSMLYCMAIVRLVNGMVEKTRKKNGVSIAEAAKAFGIPRMIIDVRHEGSHRDLPSLQLVRIASNKALDWLVWYYWEPQEKAIPTQNIHNTNMRKEIKRRLREVALCLKTKQMAKFSDVHGKRVKLTGHLYGRSKFLFLAAGKSSHFNSTGPKKQLAKSLKNILRLYSPNSSEVVYILLEYLLNALDSSNYELLEDLEIINNTENKQTALDAWKSVVLELSRKEPEFLVTLTQAILEKMDSNEARNRELDEPQTPQNSAKARKIDLLSHLLSWLIENLKTLKPVSHRESSGSKTPKTGKKLPMATIFSLLRKCLLISSSGNKQLMKSVLTLSHLTGNTSLIEKIKKLALLKQLPDPETYSIDCSNGNLLSEEEENYIRQAAEDFEIMKQRMKGKYGIKLNESKVGGKRKWVVAKSWSLCPIGMLPSNIGFSGQLPDLNCFDEVGDGKGTVGNDCETSLGKREASGDMGVEKMDERPGKRLEIEGDDVRESGEDYVGGFEGFLMVDGIWRKVGDEELFAFASAVKLLV